VTSYDDENLEPSEVREPSLDELLGELLGLIDEIVAARLADGELGRRRARIKADADQGIPTPPAPGCDGGRPTPRLVGLPTAVLASGGEWPDGLQVALAVRRTLISAAERDAEEIRGAARKAAQRYQDAALKRAAETVAAARQEAEQILAAARQEAEQIVAATQVERDQTLTTARRRTAFIFDQAQVEMPAQPAGRGGISGAVLVDHLGQDVVGVVSDLNPLLLTQIGAVSGALTALAVHPEAFASAALNRLGDGNLPGLITALCSELPTAWYTAASRYCGSFARSITLRVPEGAADDASIDLLPACNADLTGARTRWIRHQDPATRADGRAGAGHRATRAPDLPLLLGLDSIGPGDGEDCWDAVQFHKLLVQVKRYSGSRSDMAFEAPRPTTVMLALYISNWSLGPVTAIRVFPEDAALALDKFMQRWQPHDDQLALGSR